MTLNILNPLSAADYDRRLKDFIKSIEGNEFNVYVDYTGSGKRGNPTIGWGFALNEDFNAQIPKPRNPEARDYFLSTVLGVNDKRVNLSATASTREKYWQNELIRVLNSEGDFGITLVTLPTDPVIENTINGDLTPIDFENQRRAA